MAGAGRMKDEQIKICEQRFKNIDGFIETFNKEIKPKIFDTWKSVFNGLEHRTKRLEIQQWIIILLILGMGIFLWQVGL